MPVSANVAFPGTIRTVPFSPDSGAVSCAWLDGAANPVTATNSQKQRNLDRTRRGIVFHQIGSVLLVFATVGPDYRIGSSRPRPMFGARFMSTVGLLRQFPRIRPYVGTGTLVRIVRRSDLHPAITTGPCGMEDPASTILTHIRDAERLRVLRPVTAVWTVRTSALDVQGSSRLASP